MRGKREKRGKIFSFFRCSGRKREREKEIVGFYRFSTLSCATPAHYALSLPTRPPSLPGTTEGEGGTTGFGSFLATLLFCLPSSHGRWQAKRVGIRRAPCQFPLRRYPSSSFLFGFRSPFSACVCVCVCVCVWSFYRSFWTMVVTTPKFHFFFNNNSSRSLLCSLFLSFFLSIHLSRLFSSFFAEKSSN